MPAYAIRRVVICALISLVAGTALCAVAQEFRIETEVYVGDEAQPESHTVTMFEKSAVYEFIDDPATIIVYRKGDDQRTGQFILLDPATHRRTDVEASRVTTLIGKLSRWAREQKDPLLKFAADPKFEESFDSQSGDLSLVNPEWTYRVATVPAEDSTALARYRDFTDRYAELNTMLTSAPPPGPRIALDAALEKHGVVPVEIRRIIAGDEKGQVRAAHLFAWRLSRDDRARLDETREFLTNFQKVENKEFLAAQTQQEKQKKQAGGQSQ